MPKPGFEMHSDSQTDSEHRPPLYATIARLLVIPALIYYVVIGYYILVLPQGIQSNAAVEQSAFIRLWQVLINGPINIIVGLVILRRAKGNSIGAMMVLFGCGAVGSSAFDGSGGWLQVVVQFFSTGIQLPIIICLIASFPNGQLYPHKLGPWLDRFFAFACLITFIQVTSNPSLTSNTSTMLPLPNPAFILAFRPLQAIASGFYSLVLIIPFLTAVGSLYLRYRNSAPSQRKQIQWFVLGSVGFPVFIVLWGIMFMIPDGENTPYGIMVRILSSTVFFAVPAVAIGNAILRHRMYGIDIIIRRTLIYAVLTTTLATVYFGSVVLVQQLFRALTGQSSDLAIVISTLAIAALFTPLRRRTQNVIDRRLYRRKYDAEKTLEAFNRTLRDEVDIETLKAQLVGVVQETMQPTSVALWSSPPQPQQSLKETK